MLRNDFDNDINEIINRKFIPNLLALEKDFPSIYVNSFNFSNEITNELNSKYGLRDITYSVKVDLFLGAVSMTFMYKDKRVSIENEEEDRSMLDCLKECMEKDTNIIK